MAQVSTGTGAVTTLLVDTQLTLRGGDSLDADGDALSYAWSMPTRPAGSTATFSAAQQATTPFTPDRLTLDRLPSVHKTNHPTMSAKENRNLDAAAPTRRRLPRQERYRQLIGVARQIARHAGTDALTLGHLAEKAGIAKPVVYDHFATRNGLLAALYSEFDAQQNALIDAAFEASEPTLASRAAVIAYAYVDCVLAQGRELPGVSAALAGSPELQRVKRVGESSFLAKCRALLEPVAPQGHVGDAGLRAMLGAAQALASAAAAQEISAAQAKDELCATIVAMVSRQGPAPRPPPRRRGAQRA